MKPFKEFTRDLLQWDTVLTDEYICSLYIKKRYWVMFLTLRNIAVIGKSYETHRKLLWDYKKNMIKEVKREIRDNNSHLIYYKLK